MGMVPTSLKRRSLINEIRKMRFPKDRHYILSNGMMAGEFSAYHVYALVHRRTRYNDFDLKQ